VNTPPAKAGGVFTQHLDAGALGPAPFIPFILQAQRNAVAIHIRHFLLAPALFQG
jgi:hypothetical protein